MKTRMRKIRTTMKRVPITGEDNKAGMDITGTARVARNSISAMKMPVMKLAIAPALAKESNDEAMMMMASLV